MTVNFLRPLKLVLGSKDLLIAALWNIFLQFYIAKKFRDRTFPTNLYIGLVHIPFTGNSALAFVETAQQQWSEVDDPSMDRGMVDAKATLGHYLFQVTQAQSIGQVP